MPLDADGADVRVTISSTNTAAWSNGWHQSIISNSHRCRKILWSCSLRAGVDRS